MNFDRSLNVPPGLEVRLSPLVSRVLAPNPGPFTFKGTGVYIVGAGVRVAVIDPGPDMPGHIQALKDALGDRQISHILVTHSHRDHSPAAAVLKVWSGAPVYGLPLGSRTALPEESMVDEAHDHNFAPAEERALFSGDHVMGWSTSVIAPPDGDMGAYLASLEKLLARDDRIFYPTHGSPVADPTGWLGQLLAHRRMRERQILSVLADGVRPIAVLVE